MSWKQKWQFFFLYSTVFRRQFLSLRDAVFSVSRFLFVLNLVVSPQEPNILLVQCRTIQFRMEITIYNLLATLVQSGLCKMKLVPRTKKDTCNITKLLILINVISQKNITTYGSFKFLLFPTYLHQWLINFHEEMLTPIKCLWRCQLYSLLIQLVHLILSLYIKILKTLKIKSWTSKKMEQENGI